MPKYSRETVAEVVAANDIVEVIGGCLELKPGGPGRFKALCPFHHEKTPSFWVSRDRQMYYCFGCEKGGDVISFITSYEGLGFSDAIRKLAEQGGVRLPAITEKDNRDDYIREQLIAFGKFAAKFYGDMFADPMRGKPGRDYLQKRDLKPETVQKFGLGYAPDEWTLLQDAAREAGFHDGTIEAAGLVKRGDRGRTYDFFRNRLMIPIRDVMGYTVAFGGRDLSGDSPAKYINSPENPVYKKSRVLYGLYESRDAMRRAKRAILVEGYFDLLRCFDAGFENVVATCGTALTPEQAALIRRYVPEVVVVFDGDAAGLRATLRGIAILVEAGLTVRAMHLPDALDPDDFIRTRGAEAFRLLEQEALDFVSFYARMNETRLDSVEGRTDVAKEIFTILLDVTEGLRRDEYVKQVAKELGLNEWNCRNEFAKFSLDREHHKPAPEVKSAANSPICIEDRDFLAILMSDSGLIKKVQDELAAVTLKPGPLTEVLQALFDNPGADITFQLESDDAKRLYAAAANVDVSALADTQTRVDKRIAAFRIDALRLESARIQEEIRRAEKASDSTRMLELLRHKIGIDKQIQEVGAA